MVRNFYRRPSSECERKRRSSSCVIWCPLGQSCAAAEATYAEAGIEVFPADPAFEAALVEASGFVTQGWLKGTGAAGSDGQAALDFYKAQLSASAN